MIEFGPKLLSIPVMEASNPARMAATPMMVPVPMITPSTVRKARSLGLRRGWEGHPRSVRNSLARHAFPFHPQGFDGIEHGRPPRRVDAEKQADRGRQTDAYDDRCP